MPTAENSNAELVSVSALWWGILIGPVAWVLDQGISYAVDQHACSTGHFYLLHAISACSFVLAITGIFVSRQQLSHVSGGNEDGGSPRDRSWFMAWLGILMSVSFSLTIVYLAVPKIILSPCD